MQRFAPTTFRNVARRYSTAPPAASSNLAPILLGAGLVGAGAFYYSTLPDKTKATIVKKVSVDAPAALSNDEFRNFKFVFLFRYSSLHFVVLDRQDEAHQFGLFHRLAEVIPYNHNTSRFIFDLPEGTNSGLTVASALVVKSAKAGEVTSLNKKGEAVPVIRPYTPITAPDVEGKLVRPHILDIADTVGVLLIARDSRAGAAWYVLPGFVRPLLFFAVPDLPYASWFSHQ